MNNMLSLSSNFRRSWCKGNKKESESEYSERKTERINHVIVFSPSFSPPTRQLNKASYSLLLTLINALALQ